MGQLAGEIVQSRETFSFSSVIWHIVQYGCMLIEMIDQVPAMPLSEVT